MEAAEWADALVLKSGDLTVRLKHDAGALYAALEAPYALGSGESCFLLLDPDAAGGDAPGPDDLQLDFSPFNPRRLPWAESKGDGKSWVPSAAPSGWTARASAATPERIQVEWAVSLARLGPGEHPQGRLGLLAGGGKSLSQPADLNLYTPSSWLAFRLAGEVAADPGKRDREALETAWNLKAVFAKAQEARAAYAAASARFQELSRRKEPPKSQAEMTGLMQAMDAASKAYAKAVAAEPDNPLLHFEQGNYRLLAGDTDEARESFEAACALAPGVPLFTQRLYGACIQTNRFARALALAEAAAAAHPDRMEGYFLRGQVRVMLQDLDGASADLAKASGFPVDSKMGRHLDGLIAAAKTLKEAWPAEAEARKRDEAKGDLPRAEILVERGKDRFRIVVELFEEDAPNTVANFVSLADTGFYDGTRFHRVIGCFMAQGGDPFSRNPDDPRVGMGGPGWCVKTETGARKHWRGVLSMANAGPDTDGSQFFITVRPAAELDGKHGVFGRVLEGQEAVDGLRGGEVIRSVRMLRKRDHPYAPEKLPEPKEIAPPQQPPQAPPARRR